MLSVNPISGFFGENFGWTNIFVICYNYIQTEEEIETPTVDGFGHACRARNNFFVTGGQLDHKE